MLEIQQAIKEVDALQGSRKEMFELADFAIERSLDKHFNAINTLAKRKGVEVYALIADLKAKCISWYLPNGKMPEELNLLTPSERKSLIDYAKADFFQEFYMCYLTSLKLEFWKTQG